MSEEMNLVRDLAIILVAAGTFTIISKALKQPLILGYIVAGFLIGPHLGLLPAMSGMESVNQWSEIGIIFLMFALGLEFSFKKLLKVGSSALIMAGCQCLGMMTLGLLVGKAMGWSTMESIFLGGLLSMSSTAIIIKAYDEIRKLYAQQPLSKQMGYTAGFFSFNSEGGRCEECKGEGTITVEMQFMSDLVLECEACHGKRFKPEILEVRYRGQNIDDILNMSVDEALELFAAHPNVMAKLQTLADVGLGYIKLGQSSTTLSGGEAQRIKLTRELAKRSGGKTVYILDEPTTGLHFHDVKKLIGVLDSLVEKGNTVIVIEHNLDVIKSADYLIDLGPEGGTAGGQIIAKGTPEEVAKVKKSYTGQFLKQMLK